MSEITTFATQFRSQNNLGLTEPIDTRRLLRKLELVAVFRPLSTGFSGMAQKTGDYRFMMINTAHPKGRQNFTICHELYHLYYQKNFTAVVCHTEEFRKKDKEEYNADCFAADLLIPEFGVLNMIPIAETQLNGITLPTLLKIEHTYGCSRSALLYRLRKIGLIDSQCYDLFSENVIRQAREHGYQPDLYLPTREPLEVIGDYGDKARKKFEEGTISESYYISLLQDIGIDLDESIDENVATN
jgi:Zn-dependent peptidase ImmA (M78 family)